MIFDFSETDAAIVVVSSMALATSVYGWRSPKGYVTAARCALSALLSLAFLVLGHHGPQPALAVLLWIVSLLPAGEDARREKAFLTLQAFSALAFAAGSFAGKDSSWAGAVLVFASLLRLGVFPCHLGLIGFLEKASIGARLSYLIGSAIPLAVFASNAPSLVHGFVDPIVLAGFLVGSAVYFALVCLTQTQMRRTLTFGFFCSQSIALAGFVAATTHEAVHASWFLALNTLVAGSAAFLVEDAVERRVGKADSAILQGLAISMPVLGAFCLVALLELSNFPISWGFHGAETMATAVISTAPLIAVVAVIGWCLLAFGLVKSFARIFWGPASTTSRIDLDRSERWAILILVVVAALPVW